MLDEHGREVPDPTPVAVPLKFQLPESLEDRVKRIIATHVSAQAVAQGAESFEEADDFEVGDDYDPRSPYELTADHEVAPPPELSTKPVEKPVGELGTTEVVTPPPLDKTPR